MKGLTDAQRQRLELTLSRHGIPNREPAADELRLPASDPEELSTRELEVLLLIVEGMTNIQIGKQLLLTEETIKSHLRHLLAKLGAQNRTHAVTIAFRTGLVELD